MKATMNFRWFSFLPLIGLAMLFSTTAVNAQAGQRAGDCPRFTQCDQNGDGYVSQNEYQHGSIADFDNNGDGMLSRAEYRSMNRAAAKGQGNGQGLKDGNGPHKGYGAGNCQNSGQKLRGQGQSNRAGRGGGRN